MPMSDISSIATCTTCSFNQDFSNYWTANLYFRARNGSYERVPQMANQGLTGDNGGVTVYYTSPGPNQVTAFKPVSFPYRNRRGVMAPEPIVLYLYFVLRVFECLPATPPGARRAAWGGICRVASVATLARTLGAMLIRLASTPSWIPRRSLRHHAPAAFDPTSSSRCKSSTCIFS
jgi:Domain of unknown function (DUF1996)